MKRILSVFLILAMLITGIASFGIFASAANQSGVVNADALNVRSGAGTSYSIIAVLYNGASVTVTGSANDSSGGKWYKISFTYSGSQKNGYVSSSYITIKSSSSGSTSSSASTAASSTNDFEAYMTSQGFPESYKPMLRALHNQHPKWIFKAQKLGVDWNTALNQECVVGRNLVHYYAPNSWKSMEKGAYDFAGNYWYGLDGSWVAASREIIAYYMDPRNFLDDTSIFMFENLSYNSSVHNIDGVKAILADTFMKGNYTTPDTKKTYSYAQTFMTAAQKSGVSPYHLAARCRNEQGVNGAPQSLGTVPGYKNYFNFFDVQAYATSTMTAAQMGCRYAMTNNAEYLLPWTNQYKSIIGGSIFLGKGYITKQQDTLYLQKFDMLDGGNGLYYHQYMTCVFGQETEAQSLKKAYNSKILNTAMEFKIPVYNNMPNSVYKKPTSNGNNNNFLKSLSVSGYKLNRTFDKYTMTYSLTVPGNVSSITVNAPALGSGAKVSGAGKHSLVEGDNKINIKVTAPSGVVRTYTITVTRDADATPPATVSGFKSSNATDNSAKLSWNKVDKAHGYIVYLRKNNTWVRIYKGKNNYLNLKNLSYATKYQYAVKAYKTLYGKEMTSSSYPTTYVVTAPTTVSGFKAQCNGMNSIKLSWSKALRAEGYVVYRYDNTKKSWVRLAKLSGTAYTVNNLSAATSYKFAVKTYNTVDGKELGGSTLSQLVSGTALTAVSGFKSSNATDNTVRLSWNQVNGAHGYIVYLRQNNTWVRIYKGKNNYLDLKNLAYSTTYQYAVKAYKTENGHEMTSWTYPTAKVTTKPGSVSGLKVTENSLNAIKLSWDKTPRADGYVVYRYDNTMKGWVRLAKLSGTSYTLNNPKNTSEYKFAVKTYNTADGKEVGGCKLSQTTVYTHIKETVSGFKSSAVTDNSARLSWNKVNGADGYIVYLRKNNTWVRIYKGENNYLDLKNLGYATRYQYAVKAYRTVGKQEFNSLTYPTVYVVTKPGKVSSVTPYNNKTDSVTLSWKSVSRAEGYIVYIYKNNGWQRLAKLSGTSYTVKNLKSGSTYRFAVKTYNTVDGKEYGGAKLTELYTSTLPDKVDFKVTSTSAGKADFSWSNVNGATGYIVYYKENAKDSWHRFTVTLGTSYSKSGLKRGNKYIFTVKAYREALGLTFNGEFTSKTVEIK